MGLPKWAERPDVVTRKSKSVRQEKDIAEKLSGITVSGSGSGRAKGDVFSDKFLVECKRTDKASMSVKHEWLVKIQQESFAVGKTPCFNFDIQDESWTALPTKDFIEIVSGLYG